MTKSQEAVRSMYMSVHNYLVGETAVWTASAGMTAAVNKLAAHLANIDSYSAMQQVDTKGVTLAKMNKRMVLAGWIMKVANGLLAYGNGTGDRTLAGQAKLWESMMKRLPDTRLSDTGRFMSDLGNMHIASLAGYNVLPADITALNSALADFEADMLLPKNLIGYRSGGTLQLRQELRACGKHLELVLDPLVRTYEAMHGEFVLNYFNVRTIYDTGVLKRALKVRVMEAESNKALAGAMVEISPGGIVKKTSGKGQFYVQHLAGGSYTASFSKYGYGPQTVVFYVNKGETTQVVVRMNR